MSWDFLVGTVWLHLFLCLYEYISTGKKNYHTCFYSLEKNENIIIELEDGKILGASSYTVSGRKYSDFKGIPYAKPPVCMRHEIK